MSEEALGVIVVGALSNEAWRSLDSADGPTNELSPDSVSEFIMSSPGDWAIVTRATNLAELRLHRFKTPILADMHGIKPSDLTTPGLVPALGHATALFGVSQTTAQWLEDEAGISPQVGQDIHTALRAASSRFLMVIGAGLGNIIQATPAIRAISETLGHPIDVFVTNERALPLIGRSHFVNLALTDRTMLESRTYDRTFVAATAGPFVPSVNTDAMVAQRPRFGMTEAGQWMHETALYTLGLTELLPGFRMSNSRTNDYFVSDLTYESPGSDIIGICSGKRPGIWERRGWPYFEQLASHLKDKGYSVWSFGSDEEYVPGTVDKTGTGLRQNLADMMSCEFFVATDGGIYHMAEALGIPTLVLFGPTSVIKNGPARSTTRIAHTLAPCAPCNWKIDFHRCTDPICTTEMSVDFVMSEFEDLVSETTGRLRQGVASAKESADRVRNHERDHRAFPYRPEYAADYTGESFSWYPAATAGLERIVGGRGRLGDLDRVNEILARTGTDEPRMFLAALSAAFDGGDYERVVVDGIERLATDSQDSAVRLLVLRALAKREEWQSVVDLHDDTVLDPKTTRIEKAEMAFLRGVALRETGRYAEAISSFQSAMTTRPGVRRYVVARDALRTDLYRHAAFRLPIESDRTRIAVLTPPDGALPEWAYDLSRRASLFKYHTNERHLVERDERHLDAALVLDDGDLPRGLDRFELGDELPPRDERLRVVLFAHHHLARWEPHGGELSMLAIVRDLEAKDVDVLVVVANRKNQQVLTEQLEGIKYVIAPHERFEATVTNVLDLFRPDIALMWGKPSLVAAPLCKANGVPTLVFVRYWHIVCDGPYNGDLLVDPIDAARLVKQRALFDAADAVITNATHVSKVVERLHGIGSSVAYVPVHRPPPDWRSPHSSERPHVTLVNPRKAGGQHLLFELAQRLPTVPFLLIGYPTIDMPPNVEVHAYAEAPYFHMLDSTGVLLFPFDEDPCGTGRVPLEAMHCGIPVIAAARGGLGEVIPHEWLVSWDDVDEWARLVERLYFDGTDEDRQRAREAARAFDPEAGLRLVEETIESLTGGRWSL